MINTNLMADDNQYILNVNGDITSGTMTYPELVASGRYKGGTCFILDTEIQSSQPIGNDLYKTTVRLEVESLI